VLRLVYGWYLAGTCMVLVWCLMWCPAAIGSRDGWWAGCFLVAMQGSAAADAARGDAGCGAACGAVHGSCGLDERHAVRCGHKHGSFFLAEFCGMSPPFST
jgi:hypothetical protein